MQNAPIPPNESERLEAVHRLAILDTESEERFDQITREAVEKLRVPISTISIIDSDREWFKSCQGLDNREGPRTTSFCGHAMLADQIFIVEDTLLDPRFKDNPMVVGKPHIRFYAGIALWDHFYNQPIGVFCIKDTVPRHLSMPELNILLDLAKRAEDEINQPKDTH